MARWVMKRLVGGAMPVVLAGLEEDAAPRPDHLDRPAAALAQAHALGDVNLRDGKVDCGPSFARSRRLSKP
jgi:hypothetical protein